MLIEAGAARRKRNLRELATAVAVGTNDPKSIDKVFASETPLPKAIDDATAEFLFASRREEGV